MLKNKHIYNLRWGRTEFKENKKNMLNLIKISFIVKNMFVLL
jgi:hypothetical protein